MQMPPSLNLRRWRSHTSSLTRDAKRCWPSLAPGRVASSVTNRNACGRAVCSWENTTFSVVLAAHLQEAVEVEDELGMLLLGQGGQQDDFFARLLAHELVVVERLVGAGLQCIKVDGGAASAVVGQHCQVLRLASVPSLFLVLDLLNSFDQSGNVVRGRRIISI